MTTHQVATHAQPTGSDIAGYLRRLGLERPQQPTAEALFALHRAQIERVAYENIDTYLGRPAGIDALLSLRRVAAGHGGYCYQANGALGLLLHTLGFDVTRHYAGVHGTPETEGARGNHLALTVRTGDQEWLVDAGLGDGIHEPLPLLTGTYRQGPFTFRMAPSTAEPGGWRFQHDPAGGFHHMEYAPAPTGPTAFDDEHTRLTTSPESGYVKAPVVARRDATTIDVLRGRILRHTDADGTSEHELATPAAWFEALHDLFHIAPATLTDDDRTELWARVTRSHEAWLATRTS
ncbi:arylamine N-acetyltransferase [Streptomyces sp. NBC_00083]|uniref:arylamine N-acetyltransferase family protein n=1 Tax=Streptomyces sp. NBC_00083 TaxID=2975647 RepID=UPI00225644BC|nr:arylamine N-acetyltransferase [Streptomyces sp. NBC_00083]MCX5383062.1 arylamine N-acetyltransferase [Streptomyces sp. NBC_00083]